MWITLFVIMIGSGVLMITIRAMVVQETLIFNKDESKTEDEKNKYASTLSMINISAASIAFFVAGATSGIIIV